MKNLINYYKGEDLNFIVRRVCTCKQCRAAKRKSRRVRSEFLKTSRHPVKREQILTVFYA